MIALVPYGLSMIGRSAGLLIAVGAGAAYAIDGLATKFFSDDFSNSAWVGLVAWGIVMGLAAGLATLSEMSALQRRPATQVAPIVLGSDHAHPRRARARAGRRDVEREPVDPRRARARRSC